MSASDRHTSDDERIPTPAHADGLFVTDDFFPGYEEEPNVTSAPPIPSSAAPSSSAGGGSVSAEAPVTEDRPSALPTDGSAAVSDQRNLAGDASIVAPASTAPHSSLGGGELSPEEAAPRQQQDGGAAAARTGQWEQYVTRIKEAAAAQAASTTSLGGSSAFGLPSTPRAGGSGGSDSGRRGPTAPNSMRRGDPHRSDESSGGAGGDGPATDDDELGLLSIFITMDTFEAIAEVATEYPLIAASTVARWGSVAAHSSLMAAVRALLEAGEVAKGYGSDGGAPPRGVSSSACAFLRQGWPGGEAENSLTDTDSSPPPPATDDEIVDALGALPVSKKARIIWARMADAAACASAVGRAAVIDWVLAPIVGASLAADSVSPAARLPSSSSNAGPHRPSSSLNATLCRVAALVLLPQLVTTNSSLLLAPSPSASSIGPSDVTYEGFVRRELVFGHASSARDTTNSTNATNGIPLSSPPSPPAMGYCSTADEWSRLEKRDASELLSTYDALSYVVGDVLFGVLLSNAFAAITPQWASVGFMAAWEGVAAVGTTVDVAVCGALLEAERGLAGGGGGGSSSPSSSGDNGSATASQPTAVISPLSGEDGGAPPVNATGPPSSLPRGAISSPTPTSSTVAFRAFRKTLCGEWMGHAELSRRGQRKKRRHHKRRGSDEGAASGDGLNPKKTRHSDGNDEGSSATADDDDDDDEEFGVRNYFTEQGIHLFVSPLAKGLLVGAILFVWLAIDLSYRFSREIMRRFDRLEVIAAEQRKDILRTRRARQLAAAAAKQQEASAHHHGHNTHHHHHTASGGGGQSQQQHNRGSSLHATQHSASSAANSGLFSRQQLSAMGVGVPPTGLSASPLRGGGGGGALPPFAPTPTAGADRHRHRHSSAASASGASPSLPPKPPTSTKTPLAYGSSSSSSNPPQPQQGQQNAYVHQMSTNSAFGSSSVVVRPLPPSASAAGGHGHHSALPPISPTLSTRSRRLVIPPTANLLLGGLLAHEGGGHNTATTTCTTASGNSTPMQSRSVSPSAVGGGGGGGAMGHGGIMQWAGGVAYAEEGCVAPLSPPPAVGGASTPVESNSRLTVDDVKASPTQLSAAMPTARRRAPSGDVDGVEKRLALGASASSPHLPATPSDIHFMLTGVVPSIPVSPTEEIIGATDDDDAMGTQPPSITAMITSPNALKTTAKPSASEVFAGGYTTSSNAPQPSSVGTSSFAASYTTAEEYPSSSRGLSTLLGGEEEL